MLLSYLDYLDSINPRLADKQDQFLKLAAGGYIDLKDDMRDICEFLYRNLYKAFIDLTFELKTLPTEERRIKEPKLMTKMQSKFMSICDQATSMLQSKYPNYKVPKFIEDFTVGAFNNFGTPELDAWYSHEYNQHVIIFRFFEKESLAQGSLQPVKPNEFFGYIEHELTHYIQLKDYIWKTDNKGNLLLDKEEFEEKNNALTQKLKSEAKEYTMTDPQDVTESYLRVFGDDMKGFEIEDLEAAAQDLIDTDNSVLWDRNLRSEVSAHIQNIMRQLPPPTEEDVKNTHSFFDYVGQSNDFIEYITFVRNPVVKNKFLKALYVAITSNMNNPGKFDITPDDSIIFSDVENYREQKERELFSVPGQKMKSMQPMKKKKK